MHFSFFSSQNLLSFLFISFLDNILFLLAILLFFFSLVKKSLCRFALFVLHLFTTNLDGNGTWLGLIWNIQLTWSSYCTRTFTTRLIHPFPWLSVQCQCDHLLDHHTSAFFMVAWWWQWCHSHRINIIAITKKIDSLAPLSFLSCFLYLQRKIRRGHENDNNLDIDMRENCLLDADAILAKNLRRRWDDVLFCCFVE